MSESPDQQPPQGGADRPPFSLDAPAQGMLPARSTADRLTRIQVRQQIDFTPIPFELCRTALHQRGIPPKTDSVVVFVHGLNGDGYSTWGEFPARMFVSTYGVKPDVAVFDYFSGGRRYLRVRPSVPQLAEELAHCIVELQQIYDQVFLIAHSLGGLISKDAVRIYLQDHEPEPDQVKRLAGLIHFASPLKGSRWAFRFLWPAIIEIRYLWRGAKYQSDIREFFDRNVDTTDLDRRGNRVYMLPTYAGYGERDWVVDPTSATAGVFHRQRHEFRANHSQIVRPTMGSHEQVKWVENKLSEISRNRTKVREQLYRDRRASGYGS
jgi:pimeloyl-ACP methyl ester carboxylesterase